MQALALACEKKHRSGYQIVTLTAEDSSSDYEDHGVYGLRAAQLPDVLRRLGSALQELRLHVQPLQFAGVAVLAGYLCDEGYRCESWS